MAGAGDRLFSSRWVHVFEEDSGAGAVYRAEGGDLPLSRRPRERIRLNPDGSARLYAAGPDDKLVEQDATWTEEGDALVIRPARGGRVLRIVQRAPDRLVVKTG